MPLQKLTTFTKTVSQLADKPNGTMTAAQIKAQFDAAPEELRGVVNAIVDVLISTTQGDSGANNIKISSIVGVTGTDVQTALQSLKDQLIQSQLGQITDGTITLAKLGADIRTKLNDLEVMMIMGGT